MLERLSRDFNENRTPEGVVLIALNTIRMKRRAVQIILILGVSLGLISCEKGSGSLSSQYGQHKSHNHGKVCLSCHGTGGDNEYWWKLAGSIYKPDLTSYNPNGTVYLYKGKGATGILVKTIQVDGNGNIFTTDDIPTTDSLYVALQSTSGNVKYMPEPTIDFNCNNCHNGINTARIWIE